MNESMRTIVTAFATVVLLGQVDIASAAEIKVLSAVVMRPVLGEIVVEFERTTGHKVIVDFATAGVLRDRIRGGEVADMAILPSPTIAICMGRLPFVYVALKRSVSPWRAPQQARA